MMPLFPFRSLFLHLAPTEDRGSEKTKLVDRSLVLRGIEVDDPVVIQS
jgi:hypothetical protein